MVREENNQWTKYENWTDFRTDPRKSYMVEGHRTDISHFYWNLYHPEDPICFGDKMIIHHPNENHWDNSKSNQMKMTQAKHIVLHKLGKKLSKEHIRKMSDSRKGNKNPWYGKFGKDNPTSKPVIASGINYFSVGEAAKALNVNQSTVTRRIQRNKPGYSYVNRGAI